jgi:cytochrome P450
MEVVRRSFTAKLDAFVPLPSGVPTPAALRLRAAVRRLDAIVYRIIAERRRAGGDRSDLLSMLLEADMSDRQLRDEAMSLFVGGHETTAAGLAWTWHLLATHPDAEAGVLEELDDVLGDRPPTVADAPRLVRTERAIREALRLYPPVYAFDRTPIRDTTIAGRPVRAGTVVLISPYVVHRRPELYDDPESYRPERWAAAPSGRGKYAYLPFGGGPRVCIGSRFAELEMTLVLATMLRHVVARPASPPVAPEPSITLRPRGGLPLIVLRRTPGDRRHGRATPVGAAG